MIRGFIASWDLFLQPYALTLLSAALLSLIDTANVSGARFHTIQVRQADPLASSQRRGTLELIASRTGGVYRFVPDEALPVR